MVSLILTSLLLVQPAPEPAEPPASVPDMGQQLVTALGSVDGCLDAQATRRRRSCRTGGR